MNLLGGGICDAATKNGTNHKSPETKNKHEQIYLIKLQILPAVQIFNSFYMAPLTFALIKIYL